MQLSQARSQRIVSIDSAVRDCSRDRMRACRELHLHNARSSRENLTRERIMNTKSVKSVKSKSNKSAAVVAQQNVAAIEVERVKLSSHSNNIAFSDKRPGVVAYILEMLMNASAQGPVTKSYMLKKLCERFADREESKMKSTLMMQCPSGLLIEKRVVVVTIKNEATKERCYYVDRDATAKCQAEYAERKNAAAQLKIANAAILNASK